MILLVEDTPELLETLRQLLEAAGYKVFCAKTGVEALEILRQRSQEIGMLITDLVMPGMTGAELVEFSRKVHGRAMKVLMMSGEVPETEGDTPHENSAFLNKPFAGRALLEKVSAVFGTNN